MLDIFVLDIGNRELCDNGGEGTLSFVRVALNLIEGQLDEGGDTLLGFIQVVKLLEHFIV